jgi:single-strand DNA-binding protein
MKMNKVVLVGRLTKDCELKFLPGNGTATSSFTIAVDKRGKDGKREADFINCVCFGKIAENTANFTAKGSLVGVSGRIQTRTYEAKDGTRRYITEVVADEVQFLDKKTSNNSTNNGFKENYEGMELEDSEDCIPF